MRPCPLPTIPSQWFQRLPSRFFFAATIDQDLSFPFLFVTFSNGHNDRKHGIDVNIGYFGIIKFQQNVADPSLQGESQYLKVRMRLPMFPESPETCFLV